MTLKEPLEYFSVRKKAQPVRPPPDLKPMEIDTGQSRRWRGNLYSLLFFLIVAGALVLVFRQFTTSLRLAMGVVAFMAAYMIVVGWMVSRKW